MNKQWLLILIFAACFSSPVLGNYLRESEIKYCSKNQSTECTLVTFINDTSSDRITAFECTGGLRVGKNKITGISVEGHIILIKPFCEEDLPREVKSDLIKSGLNAPYSSFTLETIQSLQKDEGKWILGKLVAQEKHILTITQGDNSIPFFYGAVEYCSPPPYDPPPYDDVVVNMQQ